MNWKATQNSDGGWAYSRGCSWTEPTALVLLAQSAIGKQQDSFAAGARYLRSLEGSDGGFRPQSGVRESTWVTSLVSLLPDDVIDAACRRRAIDWLTSQTGRDSSWMFKLRQRLSGSNEEYPEGWPWFPGASAWVVPTSYAILAFDRAGMKDLAQTGRRFLMSKVCADGGWNYGANRAMGRDGDSYPETTGIALVALNGVKLDKPIAAAKKHLAECRSAEGIAWLRMGLAAHGERVPAPRESVCRTNADAALQALSEALINPLT